MKKESLRKKLWRLAKGREYADERNKVFDAYQKTLWGRMAFRAGTINTRAKMVNVSGKIVGADLLDIWTRQHKLTTMAVPCAICAAMTEEWDIDHIIPLKKGGTHTPDNLQLICSPCHAAKTRRERDPYVGQESVPATVFEPMELPLFESAGGQ